MQTRSFKGQKNLQTQSNEFNTTSFHIRQEISKLSTTTVVEIIAINVEARISPVGYVDVKPLVDQMDGAGKSVPHGVIYNVPYMRMQGGVNAFIIDPQVGDIGLCCFADRDISRVKENKKAELPGSKRMMSMADGLYIGGVLNGTPERYIIIEDDGIEINGVQLVKIIADEVSVECSDANVTTDTLDVDCIDATITAETLTIDAVDTTITSSATFSIISPAITLDGLVTGSAGAPPTFPVGINVNTKIINELHLHDFGTYNISAVPVAGNSGVVI